VRRSGRTDGADGLVKQPGAPIINDIVFPTVVDYRGLFEAAYTAQLLLDPSSKVVAVSDAYLRVTGLARSALVGCSIYEVPPYLELSAAREFCPRR
jgi:PAS domain-containing protein